MCVCVYKPGSQKFLRFPAMSRENTSHLTCSQIFEKRDNKILIPLQWPSMVREAVFGASSSKPTSDHCEKGVQEYATERTVEGQSGWKGRGRRDRSRSKHVLTLGIAREDPPEGLTSGFVISICPVSLLFTARLLRPMLSLNDGCQYWRHVNRHGPLTSRSHAVQARLHARLPSLRPQDLVRIHTCRFIRGHFECVLALISGKTRTPALTSKLAAKALTIRRSFSMYFNHVCWSELKL